MTDTQEQQTLDPTIQETFNHMLEQQHQLEQQRLQLEQLLSQARLEHAGLVLERLQESVLPQAVKEQIKARYTGRIFEEKDLDTELNSSLNMMARLAQEEGLVRGHNYEKVEISSQITEAEKIQAAFDRMFDLDIDTTRLGNIRGFNGILEAYARVTGDASLFGGISDYSTLGIIRVSESAPITRIKEADTTTASFSYLLGTSMNKRLLKDYQAWPAEWQKFVTIVPIRDFKQQTRVRLGAFGSLPIVAEDTAYQAVTLTDSAATYVAQKRGNLVTVSRETIINDDLQAIKQIPTKLAVAAAYTLAEFVYGFLSSNPGIYDGNNLFTSGVPHNNLGSSALSTAAMQTGITAMREQTNYAGKRLGLRPRYLVVPPELEWTAMVATKSAGVPGSNANDINPMLGYVLPIVSPQLTSTTQWFLVGDPKEIDVIEVGFVGGQVNPVLLIQDSPLLGLNFSQDAVSYKCRHEFGGAVVDFRGTYRGV
jgi:phage major head subunit gpT-like protein